VYGTDASPGGGIGVHAVSTNGKALHVDGVASFSRSGKAIVAGAGNSPADSVTVSNVALSSASLVLATVQGHVPGVSVAGVALDVPAGSFTIYLTEAITMSVTVAWFVVD
jgi:hypothetical protein